MADKMPSSVKLGARPISLRMRSYSSGFRPCSATRRGVTTVWSRVIGEPARLLLFLSVDTVPPRSRGGRPDLCGRPRLQGGTKSKARRAKTISPAMTKSTGRTPFGLLLAHISACGRTQLPQISKGNCVRRSGAQCGLSQGDPLGLGRAGEFSHAAHLRTTSANTARASASRAELAQRKTVAHARLGTRLVLG